MSAEITVQIAIRSRLITSAGVIALVPAGHILDRNERPVPDPSIILGEDQTVDTGDSIARDRLRIYSTLHLWKREEGLSGVKAIAWAMRSALRAGRLELGSSFQCIDCLIASQRFVRDPDGKTSHGIVTVETLVRDIA